MKIYKHDISRQISDFHLFLFEKQDEGRITPKEGSNVVNAGLVVFDQSGLELGPDANDLTVAVFRQMLHVMKQALLQMHPELMDEVRNRGLERGR